MNKNKKTNNKSKIASRRQAGRLLRSQFIYDINPATGEVITKIKCSTEKEISKAVNSARKTLKKWSELSLKQRSKLLEAIAKDFVKNKEKIGKLITDEMGKLYKSAVGEAWGTAYGIRETIKLRLYLWILW